ncbi:WcaI family glycosyltransferase [Pontibacter sp. MBLB2868]|uniref:WcaI family glycosyltransferase n=1 Tax=Pontibacter sp. MBLB2868 TaxID=3451555 RepID=UPI003F74C97B
MSKRILLIGYNYYPEPTGIGKYSGEMITWLAQNGYECEVLTSYPYYPQWKVQENYSSKTFWYSTEYQKLNGNSVRIIRCPMYVPAIPTGLKRIFVDISFFISAFFKLTQLLFRKRHDYVISVVPCFQFGLLGVFYKKLRKSILLYHVQDLQIEAARDLKMIKSPIVLNFLFMLEGYIFKNADIISSISEGMVRRIRLKAKKEVYLFKNWTDCKLFYPVEERSCLKQNFGFNTTDKIVLYSGAIGEKQGLDTIIHAARALQKQENLKFIICGSGPYQKALRMLANNFELRNVFFLPTQPLEKFNQFLNMADVHLVIQKSTAGDLVMPSKLTTILGIGGLAVITANKGTSLYAIIDQHKAGILVEPENQEALNRAIQMAVIEDNRYLRLNARTYAEEFLSMGKIMEAFNEQVLKSFIKQDKQKTEQEEPNLPIELGIG